MQTVCFHVIDCPDCYNQMRKLLNLNKFYISDILINFTPKITELFDNMVHTLYDIYKKIRIEPYDVLMVRIEKLITYYNQIPLFLQASKLRSHSIFHNCLFCGKRSHSALCSYCWNSISWRFGKKIAIKLREITKWMQRHQYIWCTVMISNREDTINEKKLGK